MTYALRWLPASRAQYEAIETDSRKARASRLAKGGKKSTKSEGLFKQLVKTLEHLKQNPKHPGLHSHEFDSLEHPYKVGEKVCESYIQN